MLCRYIHESRRKKERHGIALFPKELPADGSIIQENNSQSRRGFYMGIDNRITLQSKVVAAAEADDE
jgi:hypothetical protein